MKKITTILAIAACLWLYGNYVHLCFFSPVNPDVATEYETLLIQDVLDMFSGGDAWAVQTTDWLHQTLTCIDSANGTPTVADSAHIFVVTGDRPDSSCYNARLTSIPSSWLIRTEYPASSHPMYTFVDSTADCDCDSGVGIYNVNIRLWSGTTPTDNHFTFEITDSSFNNALTRVGQINEDTKNLDAWNPITDNDSLIIDRSSNTLWLSDAGVAAVGTGVWAINLSAYAAANYAGTYLHDTRDAVKDSIEKAITDANKVNYMRWTAAQRDSVLNTILDANKANYIATGFATSSEGDSIIQAIADANKPNFYNWSDAQRDSILNTVEDANKANYKATGFATSSECDSIEAAIADANKVNFKATGFATSTQGDSVIQAISDVNKANFKATGFATTSECDSIEAAIADANKANFKATGFATSSEGDSIIAAISDVNKANFKATGFATEADGDSVTLAITDVNKANFKYGGGADSVRAHLATHDSTLLEIAAACGSGTGARTVTITVLNIADSTTAISGFEVDVYDSSSGEFKGNGTTNSNGVIVFSLDDETYTVHITKTPWTLISPRRFVITANMDSTFYATAFDPGSPPSASECNVWTLVSDLSANWLAGCRLSIWASGQYHDITFDGTTVSPYTVTGVSNDTGYVVVPVYRSAELTAGNGKTVKMYIELRAPNSELIARTLKEIPDAASYEIVW